jgi:hypothetical protein
MLHALYTVRHDRARAQWCTGHGGHDPNSVASWTSDHRPWVQMGKASNQECPFHIQDSHPSGLGAGKNQCVGTQRLGPRRIVGAGGAEA